MFISVRPMRQPDRAPSPLAAVTNALERAVALGELTPSEYEWSLARLSGRPHREHDAGSGDRREEILGVATRVFLRDGYHHATIEQVAAELSLTKAAIYHYFSSKQEILQAISDAALEASARVISEGLSGPGSPTERLRRTAAGYADLVMADDRLLVFIRHFDELSEVGRAQIRKRRRRLTTLLRATLDEGVGAGAFEISDTSIAVHGLFGTINWIYSWYDREGARPRAAIREELVDQVMRGVRGPEPDEVVLIKAR